MQSPGSKNKSKKRAEKGPAQRLRQRTAILILLILVLGYQCGLAYVVSLCIYQIGTLLTGGGFGIGTDGLLRDLRGVCDAADRPSELLLLHPRGDHHRGQLAPPDADDR